MKRIHIPLLTLGVFFYIAEGQDAKAQKLSCYVFIDKCLKLVPNPEEKKASALPTADQMCSLFQDDTQKTACLEVHQQAADEDEAKGVDTYDMCYKVANKLDDNKQCTNPDGSYIQ